MGIIGATFKLASTVNDSIPFTPQTKTLYNVASKVDVLNILPEYPDPQQEEQSEVENISKTLVNGNGNGNANGHFHDPSSDNLNKIKEKLILSRRIKIAINEQDKEFSVENIMRHNHTAPQHQATVVIPESGLLPPYSISRKDIDGVLAGDLDSDEDSDDEDAYVDSIDGTDEVDEGRPEVGLSNALGYLVKSLTNDKVVSDDALFEQFFSNSIVQIINTVSRTRPGFKVHKIANALDRRVKFTFLAAYLNDDALITDFKATYQRDHPQLSNNNSPRRVVSSAAKSVSRSRSPNTFSTSAPVARSRLSNRKNDQLMVKTVRLIIALCFKSLAFWIRVVFPLVQLVWVSFLELNDHYQVVNRASDLVVSFFTMFIDQMFLFIDNGESFETGEVVARDSGFLKGSNRTYFNIFKALVTDKLSSASRRQERGYKFEASSTPI